MVHKAANNADVGKKRLDSFAKDINSYTFLPDFVEFQPPKNLDLPIKIDIYRYPTLLANNIKVCMGWDMCYSWDIFTKLHSEKIISTENYWYINIVLALSIYMRTSAYLGQGSQIQLVSLYSHAADNSTSLHQLPGNLFITLGCLLSPIKQSIQSSVNSNKEATLPSLVRCLFEDTLVDKSDFLLKAEVYYFSGRYSDALKELTKVIGNSIELASCAEFLKKTSHHFQQAESAKKYIELCCYLLYYTKHYAAALDYINWLIVRHQDVGLWKLVAAHCKMELSDYRTTRELLNEVSGSKESCL